MTEPQPNLTFRSMIPVVAVLSGLLALFGIVRGPAMWCVNDMSRWDTVWSLVERGTYAIGTDAEPEPWPTIDKVKKDGVYYSAKTTLLPTVFAKDYWLLHHLFGLNITDPKHTGWVTKLIVLKWNVIPLVAFVWFYGLYLHRHARSIWGRPFWLLTAGFGTYLTGYTTTVNNHTVAAIATFFALYFLVRILYDREDRWYYYLAAGAAAGWSATNEMISAPLAIAVGVLLLVRGDWRKTLTWTVPPALVIAAGFFFTNWLALGSIVPAQLQKNSALYHYEGSHWNNPVGIDAQHEPWPIYVFHMTLGHHGILSLSPVFLFVPVSFVVFLASKQRRLAALHWLSLGLTALVGGFYTLASNVDHNYGGGCKGLRWFFWLMPLWLMVAPLGSEVWSRHRWVRGLAIAALCVSVWTTLDAVSAPWGSSWLHVLFQRWGIVGY